MDGNDLPRRLSRRVRVGLLLLGLGPAPALAGDAPKQNACPVDGCEVRIVDVRRAGDELELTYEANFLPDVARNHIHAWWGDLYTVEQASRDAETRHGVTKGKWHRHDDYPTYVTTEAASTTLRQGSTTICVSPADRGHNILDVSIRHCVDVARFF